MIYMNKITLNKSNLTLKKGTSEVIMASVLPKNASCKCLEWISSDSDIVTVNEVDELSCYIYAKNKGTATIYAVAEDGTDLCATCTVKVTVPVSSVTITSSISKMEINQTATLKTSVKPSTASNKKLYWYSSNDNIISVDSSGKITAKAIGTAEICAVSRENSSKRDSITIKVYKPVTSVQITSNLAFAAIGSKYTLSANVLPSDATDKTLSWHSSNSEVVSVNETTGRITVKGEGVAEICAISKQNTDVRDSIWIETFIPVNSVSVTPKTKSLQIGKGYQLTATTSPSNAYYDEVMWESSNENVVSVDQITGYINANNLGTACIIATATDRGYVSDYATITVTPVPVSSVSITTSIQTMPINKTVTLSATVNPSNATNKTLNWYSSNDNIISVNSSGKITAKAIGTAEICAVSSYDSSKRDSISIEVYKPVTSVNITSNMYLVYKGMQYDLNVNVLPSDAKDTTVSWHSSNDNIISVDENTGRITVKDEGVVEICAISNLNPNISDTITLEAIIPVTSVNVSPKNLTLKVGHDYQLSAEASPTDASTDAMDWESSDESIVSVNPYNGYITANNPGTAYIYATATDREIVSDYATITVPVPVESVTINPANLTLHQGNTYSLHTTVLPTNAQDKSIEWCSSDPSIVSVVHNTGHITAVGEGTAIVTATAKDRGTVSGFATVHVGPPIPVQGIVLCNEEKTMNVGETAYISYDIIPSNAANKNVTWRSSNPNVAEVDETTGKITAKSVGTATITVTTVDGGFVVSCLLSVNPLLIYQTRDTEVKWFPPNVNNGVEEIRPDLHYNHLSKSEIINAVSCINELSFKKYLITHHDGSGDYYPKTISDYINSFLSMAKTYFSNNEFKPIITDMIEHFVGQKNTNFSETIDGFCVYENIDLTEKVKEHSESTAYVNNIKNTLNSCLKDNRGNIISLRYDPAIRFLPDERKKLPFVNKALEDGYDQPKFDSVSDITTGFTICLDSLQGNKVEILSYYLSENTYSGTMKFIYYDHFGLDVNDMTGNYGFKSLGVTSLAGFSDWFILQHCNELDTTTHSKPFITKIEFVVDFVGSI